mmetsp:Transcript_3810/g.5408  ORF Transcript_3810/g.5408 Transcript_3810/m.5408 type:complete len:1330 (-) Transcript_3810:11-4000(-)
MSPTQQPLRHPSHQPSNQPFFVSTSLILSKRLPQRVIDVVLNKEVFSSDSVTVKLLVISFFADPSTDLQLTINLNDSSFPNSNIFPSNFTVKNTQSGILSLTTYIRPSVIGNYSYFVTMKGRSANDYKMQYSNGMRSFSVISQNQQPPPPTLISAVFSDDGTFLAILFDSPTNRGNTDTSFLCNSVIHFPCSNVSQCQWIDSMTIHAFIDGSSPSCVIPGDLLRIVKTASIKAQCQAANGICPSYSSWSNSSQTSVIVSGPSSTIKPVPIISCPSKIGTCSNLIIDISGSKGSGGRYWSSISIRANSSLAVNRMSALNRFLRNMKVFYPPTPIPYTVLEKGHSYEFVVRLCNFLGSCGEASVIVNVVNDTIPSITLPGNAVRFIARMEMLTVISAVSVSSCGEIRFSGVLDYEWSMYVNSTKQLSLTSISKDKTTLILPSFSLATHVSYSIVVEVSLRASLPRQSSSASIEVHVIPGSIRAVINGGLMKNMAVSTSMDIDASNSYDEDKSGVAGYDAGLDFSWSCSQTFPSFESFCHTNFLMSSLGSLVRVTAAESSAGNIYQIKLLVNSVVDSRSSTLTVTVSVQSALSVIVNAYSNSFSTKMNPCQSIKLNGIISMPKGVNNITARWTVDDPSISLNQIALTPVQYRLSSSSTSNFLVLPPHTLLGGYTLTFTLSCISALHDEVVASSSVSVIINSSPKPGTFSVSPSVGTELKDMFLFNAELWMDVDLPLYYQFAYVSSTTESLVVLQSRSVVSYGRSQLPAGLDSNNNEVMIAAQIFDELNANTSASFIATVRRGPTLTLIEMQKFISSTANQSFYSVNEIKVLNALSLYLMNSVDCSLAPNCSELNRKNCASTANTCGGCKSKDYIGDSFDNNSPCFLPDVASNTTICGSSFDCIYPRVCFNHSCVFPSKNCSNQCNGHGRCSFKDINTGLLVPDCRINDEQCTSSCICDDAYSGSQWCNLRKEELEMKQVMRKQAIDNVNYLMSQEYPDQFVIPGWISILVDATKASDELNDDTMTDVLRTANEIIQITVQSTASNDILSQLLSAVDSATLYALNKPSDTTSEGGVDMNSVLNHTLSTLMLITTALSDSLVPGQDAIHSLQSSFKSTVVKLSPSSHHQSTLSVCLPQSQSETLLNVPASSLTLIGGNINTAVQSPIVVSIVSLRSTFYQNGSSFKTNPLTIHMSESPCNGLFNTSCAVELCLRNSQHISDGNHSATKDIEVHCRKGVYENKKQSCLNGRVVETICNGSYSGTLVYHCPPAVVSTACVTLFGSQLSNLLDPVCHLTNHTADYSVCRCDINAIQHSYSLNRKLVSSPGNGSLLKI